MVNFNEKPEHIFQYDSQFEYYPLIDPMEKNERSEMYKSAFNYTSFSYSRTDLSSPVTEEPEGLFSTLFRVSITFVSYLLLALTFPVSVWLCIKYVPSLERIVVFRLGRRLPLKGPGLVMVLPCVDNIVKVDLRPKVVRISPQQVLTSDRGIIEVEARFECRTVDVVHSILSLRDGSDVVKRLGQCCLVNLFSDKDVEDAEQKRSLLQSILKEQLNRSLLSWGLEVTLVEIPPVRVVKEAEPSTAMSTLVTALKSSLGLPDTQEGSQHVPGTLPAAYGAMNPTMASLLPLPSAAKQTNENQSNDVNFMDSLNDIVHQINKDENFNARDAIISLNIIGNSKELTHYFVVSEGKASIRCAISNNAQPDVVISASLEVLQDITTGIVSATQMFLENRLQAVGDLNLLQEFAEMAKNAQNKRTK